MDNLKPARVLHVIPNMKREGAQTFIMNVYRNIDREKLQFDFLVNTNQKCSYDDEIKDMGGRIIRIQKPNKINLFNYSEIISKTIKENGPYNSIHGHIMFFNGIIMVGASKARIPIRISHSHNTNDGKKESFVRQLYRNYMRKKILKYSTNLFGCSKEACKYLYGENCFRDDRVKVINNGIELDKYKKLDKNPQILRRKLGLPLDCILIGHVGRFHPQKNHRFLIDIFYGLLKKEPKARLVLVGDGPLREEIELKIKEKHLEDYVYFLGVRKDIPDIMGALDLFLLPSLYEGLGIVLVEAQAAGVPCIVSNTVPKDVDMGLELIKYIDLNDKNVIWVENILESVKIERQDWQKIEEAIGYKKYDIKSVSGYLCNIYS